ncbi:hypothetical protein OIU78_001520 [Salix suchowensis]|nr:hypothetical protein OIU78_001520 [Salix suchowensis]
MVGTRKKPHVIFVPYPLQGHVIPAVHLAIKLASQGLTVTFINTQAIHHQTSKAQPNGEADIFAKGRESGLDIRYTTVSDGLPVGFDRSLNHDQFMAALIHVFSAHVDEVVGQIVKSDDSVRCMIADTFFVWPSKIAKKFGLVYVSFWTEPALVFSLYYHMDLLMINGHFACQDCREDTIDYIPGVKAIEPKDMASYLQETDTTSISHQIIFKILWSESDCTQWLDKKAHGSVLYVSFGSYAHVAKRDLVEIANGLSLSKVSFVWVLRPDIVSSDDVDPLPDGFEEEVADRAMIIPWCSQRAVLAHPAIGGFLTHCGWNSILESIWCQVPVLGLPLLTDQFTNRKLVVDDWKIGINLSDGKLVTKEEVSKNVKRLMSGKSEDAFRNNIKEMKKTLENALSCDGSSEKNMALFIKDLEAKISEKMKPGDRSVCTDS